ncbi:MAG: META domain-containing protein [Desulfobacterales bacterium]|jgi:heat shock protein HslJ/membrane-bound inhibitor of C-type lysozyme|nr:META domain-containing protein [Desulfobacterales bacterium]MCU0562262.1 META domain-containing protein [Desulfobacterales bacterium]
MRILGRQTVWAVSVAFTVLASGCSDPLRTEPAANEPLEPRPVEQVAFGTPYMCGEASVNFGVLGERARMAAGGEVFDLKPVASASGARYRAVDGTETGFWSKGERALVTVRGEALPECRAVREPELPFTARGQEPGWMITIDADAIFLNADYGALQLRFPRAAPQAAADGIRYRTAAGGRRLSVWIQPRICADSATGMPHPYQARYELDGKGHPGCGGEPKSLLTGGEWIVETIGAAPVVDQSEATILFMEEGRVAGNASCNRFVGGYQLTGEGLSFSQMGTTMMACEEALSRQEERFLELLQAVFRFEISPERRLVLHAPDGRSITAKR